MDEKQAAEDEANRCAGKLDRANRLINALGSESERWAQSIEDLGKVLDHVVGDVLLASAFVSYVGPFNKQFRDKIMAEDFISYFREKDIPLGDSVDPIQFLTDEAEIAEWNTQGLPTDTVSVENGSILTNSERYPLMIDPQLQGITWIKNKESDKDLQITRLTNKRMIKIIEFAIETGQPVLLENIEETIDAILQPVFSRSVIRRGKNEYYRMGDKELSLHPDFKLFFQTKLSNPHYAPEIQAECTLINFTVTEQGLEDQLLALVVKKERPDLAQQKTELVQQ